MTLIHCALLCEAQALIEFYKLQKVNSKIYKNDQIVILISGVGKQNTILTLDYMFLHYNISKAINIGVAGCSDTSIDIGEIFCTNHILQDINYLPLKTVDIPQTIKDESTSCLYDMEGRYFLEISSNYIEQDNMYIFKIVSDHLSDEILKKDFIKTLIHKHIKNNKIPKYIS